MTSPTIGQYLVDALYKHGVRHIFGVPGDFVLGFYELLEQSKIKVINTCDEQSAGFAADAYGRLHGLGAVCVTYSVGGFKIMNTTAEAFAEKSPVVVISGAPGLSERQGDAMLHHRAGQFNAQEKAFKSITLASAILTNPETAAHEIDRVLYLAASRKRPVYIELPRDMVLKKSAHHHPFHPDHPVPNEAALNEALSEVQRLVKSARRCMILAGVEIHRFKLQKWLLKLAEKNQLPVAATLLGKSVIPESHPLYLGVYEGAMSHPRLNRFVEQCDGMLVLGAFKSDINTGIYTAKLPKHHVTVTEEKTVIGHHTYEHVGLEALLPALCDIPLKRQTFKKLPTPRRFQPFHPSKKRTTVAAFFACLNERLTDDHILVSDVGDALFGASELHLPEKTRFVSPAYYASIGFGIPAALGAQCAMPGKRVIVLVGDGAFQMTGMELSTFVRYGWNPIVFLLDNDGYGTERPMIDGEFNDLHRWNYEKIPAVLGGGKGYVVETTHALQKAADAALADATQFHLIRLKLRRDDITIPLQRLTTALKNRVK